MPSPCETTGCKHRAKARGLCRRHYDQFRGGRKIQPIPDTVRFEAKVIPEPNSGCWIWLSTLNNMGRPTFYYERRRQQAARVAFILYRGPIPQGLHACHSCDIPLCVNPGHIWLGTPADNVRDMMAKGRHRTGPRRAGGGGVRSDGMGVSRHQSGKWRAYVHAGGKQIHIGTFTTRDAAAAARAEFLAITPPLPSNDGWRTT